jgi:hypothetical protein
MSVKEIEIAITQLPADDLAELMAWLENYHAQAWDKQIEEDLEAGRLDTLLTEIEQEYKAGLASRYEAFGSASLLATLQTTTQTSPRVGGQEF